MKIYRNEKAPTMKDGCIWIHRSKYKDTSSPLIAEVWSGNGWGVLKNIATNFVGIDKQRVIAEAFADLYAQVEGINEKLTNGIDRLKVGHLLVDRELSGLNVAGTFCLQGAGVPSASVIPDNWDFERYGDWKGIPQFIGQEYFDTTNKVFYKAHGVGAVADWKRITNA